MRGTIVKRLVVVCGILLAVAVTPGSGKAEVIQYGPRGCKGIALTFDLCPVKEGSGYDQPLIDLLVGKRIPATFFMSGRWMAKHDREVKALLTVPFFEIGTHGHVHAHLPELDERAQRGEVQKAVNLLQTRYARQATLFRPPYGEYNDVTVKVADSLGLTLVLWNVVSGDPDPSLAREHIVQAMKVGVKTGSIVVFHANGKGRHTRAVIEDLHDYLLDRGLQPMTITELMTCAPPAQP